MASIKRKIGKILPKKVKYLLNTLYSRFSSIGEKQRIKELYKKFLRPGDLVFDLGANIGRDTKILSELGTKIIAVEPVPSLVKELKRKFEKDKGVIILGKGIASKNSKMELNICDNSPQHSTFVEVEKTP
jgi:16S rRNA A1518/A1519 N6-dimethyltransferase RsmA/KsgA/DIM1 with predicted DNA glycosylase/AP lyase activity